MDVTSRNPSSHFTYSATFAGGSRCPLLTIPPTLPLDWISLHAHKTSNRPKAMAVIMGAVVVALITISGKRLRAEKN